MASDVTFNGMTSLLNFVNKYQSVQTLLVGESQTDGQTDGHRYHGDLINLSFLFLKKVG
jgi:hypothetical protein